MKSHFFSVVLIALASAAVAQTPTAKPLPWDVSDALATAKPLTLYSLDPSAGADPNGFHGWKVLGQTTITDAGTRKQVAQTIIDSVAHADQLGARCFIPHHALRFSKGTVTYDLVICFECRKLEVYTTGIPIRVAALSKEGEKILDSVLSAARIPVVKRL